MKKCGNERLSSVICSAKWAAERHPSCRRTPRRHRRRRARPAATATREPQRTRASFGTIYARWRVPLPRPWWHQILQHHSSPRECQQLLLWLRAPAGTMSATSLPPALNQTQLLALQYHQDSLSGRCPTSTMYALFTLGGIPIDSTVCTPNRFYICSFGCPCINVCLLDVSCVLFTECESCRESST